MSAMVLFASCGAPDDCSTVECRPNLRWTPTIVEFGNVRVRSSQAISLVLSTEHDLALVEDIYLLEEMPTLTVTWDGGEVIDTLKLPVKVTFTPSAIGMYENTLVIRHTGLNDPVEIPVSGNGVAPGL